MGPSIWQIAIVVVIVLAVFFGPKRIPALAKSLGEAIRNFRKGLLDKEDSSAKAGKKDPDSKKPIKDVDSA